MQGLLMSNGEPSTNMTRDDFIEALSEPRMWVRAFFRGSRAVPEPEVIRATDKWAVDAEMLFGTDAFEEAAKRASNRNLKRLIQTGKVESMVPGLGVAMGKAAKKMLRSKLNEINKSAIQDLGLLMLRGLSSFNRNPVIPHNSFNDYYIEMVSALTNEVIKNEVNPVLLYWCEALGVKGAPAAILAGSVTMYNRICTVDSPVLLMIMALTSRLTPPGQNGYMRAMGQEYDGANYGDDCFYSEIPLAQAIEEEIYDSLPSEYRFIPEMGEGMNTKKFDLIESYFGAEKSTRVTREEMASGFSSSLARMVILLNQGEVSPMLINKVIMQFNQFYESLCDDGDFLNEEARRRGLVSFSIIRKPLTQRYMKSEKKSYNLLVDTQPVFKRNDFNEMINDLKSFQYWLNQHQALPSVKMSMQSDESLVSSLKAYRDVIESPSVVIMDRLVPLILGFSHGIRPKADLGSKSILAR